MNSFVIIGKYIDRKVWLTASSCVYDIHFDRRTEDLMFYRSSRMLTDYEMTIRCSEPVSFSTDGGYAEAWPKFMELWQPPEPKQLATAILLGKKPEPNPLFDKDLVIKLSTWLPGDPY